MFYCNQCGRERKWPIDSIFRSYGTCEICNTVQSCNDVPSKYLPEKINYKNRGEMKTKLKPGEGSLAFPQENNLEKLAEDILEMLSKNKVDQYGKLLELLYISHKRDNKRWPE